MSDSDSKMAIPLVVAVTGHRDLVSSELDDIRSAVRELLVELRERYPERRLRVMSALAEGADRLAAHVALELGIELTALLPMPKELYEDDFETPQSKEEFEILLEAADEIYELPVARGGTTGGISTHGDARNRQYAQLGVFICAHCHVLLALWDGKLTNDLGGTGQVVKFHHDDIMPGYTTKTVATQQMLVDDESDLVCHIVCSRDRDDGAPQDGLKPLDRVWFTQDRDHPRSTTLPRQHRMIFERTAEFSRDVMKNAQAIETESYPLFEEKDRDGLPPGVDAINRLFCMADWLAIHYQKKTLYSLRVTHVLALLMGLSFILYTDYEVWPFFMAAFLLFFVVSALL